MEKKDMDPREVKRAFRALRCGRVHSDVLGSYTGMGECGEEPEQDADDL